MSWPMPALARTISSPSCTQLGQWEVCEPSQAGWTWEVHALRGDAVNSNILCGDGGDQDAACAASDHVRVLVCTTAQGARTVAASKLLQRDVEESVTDIVITQWCVAHVFHVMVKFQVQKLSCGRYFGSRVVNLWKRMEGLHQYHHDCGDRGRDTGAQKLPPRPLTGRLGGGRRRGKSWSFQGVGRAWFHGALLSTSRISTLGGKSRHKGLHTPRTTRRRSSEQTRTLSTDTNQIVWRPMLGSSRGLGRTYFQVAS